MNCKETWGRIMLVEKSSEVRFRLGLKSEDTIEMLRLGTCSIRVLGSG